LSSPAPAAAETVEMIIERLTAAALPTAQARLAELGEKESGASNFYAVRIGRGELFANYERALVEALQERGLPREVHEIGGGFGTLSWLFAALGLRAVCLEHDRRRFAGAEALWVALAMADAKLAARLELRRESFPSTALAPRGATALITNLVFTTAPEVRAGIIAALARYPEVILDVDRFLVSSGPDERPALLDEFARAGLLGEPFLDMGVSACFYRFRPADGGML
jgi:hypothetical protein